MNKLRLLCCTLMLLWGASVASLRAQTDAKVYDNNDVEQKATFIGGEQVLLKFIGDQLQYPEIAMEQNVQGTVVLRLKVDAEGNVSDIKIKKSLSRECDKEAIRVVSLIKSMNPAVHNGKRVPVWITLPVRFLLN